MNFNRSFHKLVILRSWRKGVTLIELAIVIMVLSVIFVGMFSMYFTSITITNTVSPQKGNTQIQTLATIENIRSTIANTYFLTGHKKLIFIGEGIAGSGNTRSDKLVFASSQPNSTITLTPEVREVAFYLKNNINDDDFILIKREDEMVDDDPRKGGIENHMLNFVKSFKLEYSENGQKWVDEWDSIKRQKLPRLIKIEIIVITEGKVKTYETLAFPGLYIK